MKRLFTQELSVWLIGLIGMILSVAGQGLRAKTCRLSIPLDGIWRVSDPVPMSTRTFGALKLPPHVRYHEFQAPLNTFKVWQPYKTYDWDSSRKPANPQMGTSLAHSLTRRARGLFQGKPYLTSLCTHDFVAAPGKGRRWYLHFEGAATYTTVLLNNAIAGRHVGAHTSFKLEVTKLLREGSNTLSLLCTVPVNGEQFMNWGASIYYVSGPWRSVALVGIADPGHEQSLIDCDVTKRKLTIRTRFLQRAPAGCSLCFSVTDDRGNRTVLGECIVPQNSRQVQASFPFNGPLWSPESPHMHTLHMTIKIHGHTVDEAQENFGFRSVSVKGHELLLNGMPYRIHGYGGDGNYFGGEGYGSQVLLQRYSHLYRRYKEHFANGVRWHNPIVKEGFIAADQVGFVLYPGWNNACSKKFHMEFGDAVWGYVTEYISQNYNHPCVFMWHFSNEDWDRSELKLADRIYDTVRRIEHSGRPIVPDSGSYSFPWLPGAAGHTDLIDLHNYCGTSFKGLGGMQKRPFTMNMEVTRKMIQNASQVLGKSLPVIIGEAQAQVLWNRYSPGGWQGEYKSGQRAIFDDHGAFRPPFLDELQDYSRATWADVGHNVRNTGLVAYFLGDGHPQATGLKAWTATENWKRTFEHYRLLKLPAVFLNYGHVLHKPLKESIQNWTLTQLIFQPSLPIATTLDRQPISGEKLNLELQLDSLGKRADSMTVRLEDDGGKILAQQKISDFPDSGLRLHLSVPSAAEGPGMVRLLAYDRERLVGENFYHVSLTKPVWREGGIDLSHRIVLWRSKGAKCQETSEILQSLHLKHEIASLENSLATLRPGDWLIMPPASDFKSSDYCAKLQELKKRLALGVNMLVLEQSTKDNARLAPNTQLLHHDWNITADPVPASDGFPSQLPWHKFWIWRGAHGVLASHVLPCNVNSMILVGSYEDDRLYSVLSVGKVGKGVLVHSQLRALERFDSDGGASLYLYELLKTAFSNRFAQSALPWKKAYGGIELSRRDLLRCVNLRPFFNRSWSDDVPGDGKGGWTDEGKNDFSHFNPPRGEEHFQDFQASYNKHIANKAWLLGIPFDIPVDGVKTPAAIVLMKGLMDSVEIPLNEHVKTLLLLGLTTSSGRGAIRLRYEDGTAFSVPSAFPDWWSGRGSRKALLAWEGLNPKSSAQVKCFVQPIVNPHPGKRIISVTLSGEHLVLLGATIELTD